MLFFLKSCQWQYIVMFYATGIVGYYDCMRMMLTDLCFVQSLEFGFERVCSCLASGHILDSAVLQLVAGDGRLPALVPFLGHFTVLSLG